MAAAFRAASLRASGLLAARAFLMASLRFRRASSVSVTVSSSRAQLPLRLSPSSTFASHGRRASASAASSRSARASALASAARQGRDQLGVAPLLCRQLALDPGAGDLLFGQRRA